MRIIPPLLSIPPRKTTKPETFGDWTLPVGCQVIGHSGMLGLDPNVWDNPYEYRPERFLPENAKKVHPFSVIPFGAGKRFCLGKQFALQEMHIVLTSIFQHYEIEMPQTAMDIASRNERPKIVLQFPFVHPDKSLTKFFFHKRKVSSCAYCK